MLHLLWNSKHGYLGAVILLTTGTGPAPRFGLEDGY